VAANYVQRLHRLAFNEQNASAEDPSVTDLSLLDPKSLALARLAALVAVGGAEASFGEQVSAAVSVGASTDELVDVLEGIASIVGTPRIVAAAPQLALALGFDVEDADG
jgi:alkylhydroperoxidase/carboxymuconolactone decarboxylase family protein YurZ